jgi:AmmeMemoRadiSam system protein B
MLDRGKPPKVDGKIMALISPHAGYRFSGKAAATGYALLRGQDIRRVIVLAISHHLPFRGASIADVTHFETPLGLIPLDSAAVARLRRSSVVSAVERAEIEEHSLEMQLPLLQRVLPSFSLVPILVGRMSDADYAELANVLAEIVDAHTLVVASSDFTHRGDNYGYEVPAGKGTIQERLARVDDGSVEQILKLRRRGLLDHADRTGTTICGLHPIALLLELLAKFPGHARPGRQPLHLGRRHFRLVEQRDLHRCGVYRQVAGKFQTRSGQGRGRKNVSTQRRRPGGIVAIGACLA